MNQVDIRSLGYFAFVRALEFDGMIRLIHQYDRGAGNYTLDRRQWLDGVSLDEIWNDEFH